MIKRDIARTFPDHSFFKDKDGIGQGTLFNVIKVNQCSVLAKVCTGSYCTGSATHTVMYSTCSIWPIIKSCI